MREQLSLIILLAKTLVFPHVGSALQVFWSPGFTPQLYDYSALMEQDEALFQFLSDVEQNATALVKKVPCRPQAALDLTNRIGRVQQTHYGSGKEEIPDKGYR